MKKKIFFVCLAVCMAIGTVYHTKLKNDVFQDLDLSNVEALASNEGWTYYGFKMKFNDQTGCKSCERDSGSCQISDQCCRSWGNCN